MAMFGSISFIPLFGQGVLALEELRETECGFHAPTLVSAPVGRFGLSQLVPSLMESREVDTGLLPIAQFRRMRSRSITP